MHDAPQDQLIIRPALPTAYGPLARKTVHLVAVGRKNEQAPFLIHIYPRMRVLLGIMPGNPIKCAQTLHGSHVELCTIPSYLNYILLYLAWLYKPARILVSA
jgi:hypothetical protein